MNIAAIVIGILVGLFFYVYVASFLWERTDAENSFSGFLSAIFWPAAPLIWIIHYPCKIAHKAGTRHGRAKRQRAAEAETQRRQEQYLRDKQQLEEIANFRAELPRATARRK